MPTLYLAEYSDVGSTQRGALAIPLEPPQGEQVIDIGPNSVQSEAFKPATCIVKLVSDEDCVIEIGSDPDATNAVRKLLTGKPETISVTVGSKFKVAVVAVNSGSVTEMDSLGSLLKLLASPADAQKQFAVLQANADKMTSAAKDLRAAGAENKTIHDQLVQATQDALTAKDEANRAAADAAARQAALDKASQNQADKIAADKVAASEQAEQLAARETELAANIAALDKKAGDIAAMANTLDTREKDLTARETAVAASQADYEARIAKLKALTN